MYCKLLPRVQELLGSNDVAVREVFLRRYGQDLIDRESRSSISAHYDVYAKVTSVFALDNIAADGRNGLYTVARSNDGRSVSNHAALRRFFHLSSGDGVIRTWDVFIARSRH